MTYSRIAQVGWRWKFNGRKVEELGGASFTQAPATYLNSEVKFE